MEGILPKSPKSGEERINIRDPEDAQDFVFEMIKNGETPYVSVPERYLSALEKGLRPHSSWIAGFDAIVGTLGRNPYLPEGEKRVLVCVKKINPENVHPRFTGPDKAFHGVIVLDGPIEPDCIEVTNQYT